MSRSILWDYWARFYNGLWVQKWSLGPTRKMVLEYIKTQTYKNNDLHILDMGCGTGQLLSQLDAILPNYRKHLTGVDYSKGMLDVAREENPGINFIQSEVLEYSVSERYDLILISHSLPYYEDQLQAVQHMMGHLKPGGTLIITNASATTLYDKVCLLMIKITTGSAHYPSMKEIKHIAGQSSSDVQISRVKTAWFVPTIYFLTAKQTGMTS